MEDPFDAGAVLEAWRSRSGASAEKDAAAAPRRRPRIGHRELFGDLEGVAEEALAKAAGGEDCHRRCIEAALSGFGQDARGRVTDGQRAFLALATILILKTPAQDLAEDDGLRTLCGDCVLKLVVAVDAAAALFVGGGNAAARRNATLAYEALVVLLALLMENGAAVFGREFGQDKLLPYAAHGDVAGAERGKEKGAAALRCSVPGALAISVGPAVRKVLSVEASTRGGAELLGRIVDRTAELVRCVVALASPGVMAVSVLSSDLISTCCAAVKDYAAASTRSEAWRAPLQSKLLELLGHSCRAVLKYAAAVVARDACADAAAPWCGLLVLEADATVAAMLGEASGEDDEDDEDSEDGEDGEDGRGALAGSAMLPLQAGVAALRQSGRVATLSESLRELLADTALIEAVRDGAVACCRELARLEALEERAALAHGAPHQLLASVVPLLFGVAAVSSTAVSQGFATWPWLFERSVQRELRPRLGEYDLRTLRGHIALQTALDIIAGSLRVAGLERAIRAAMGMPAIPESAAPVADVLDFAAGLKGRAGAAVRDAARGVGGGRPEGYHAALRAVARQSLRAALSVARAASAHLGRLMVGGQGRQLPALEVLVKDVPRRLGSPFAAADVVRGATDALFDRLRACRGEGGGSDGGEDDGGTAALGAPGAEALALAAAAVDALESDLEEMDAFAETDRRRLVATAAHIASCAAAVLRAAAGWAGPSAAGAREAGQGVLLRLLEPLLDAAEGGDGAARACAARGLAAALGALGTAAPVPNGPGEASLHGLLEESLATALDAGMLAAEMARGGDGAGEEEGSADSGAEEREQLVGLVLLEAVLFFLGTAAETDGPALCAVASELCEDEGGGGFVAEAALPVLVGRLEGAVGAARRRLGLAGPDAWDQCSSWTRAQEGVAEVGEAPIFVAASAALLALASTHLSPVHRAGRAVETGLREARKCGDPGQLIKWTRRAHAEAVEHSVPPASLRVLARALVDAKRSGLPGGTGGVEDDALYAAHAVCSVAIRHVMQRLQDGKGGGTVPKQL